MPLTLPMSIKSVVDDCAGVLVSNNLTTLAQDACRLKFYKEASTFAFSADLTGDENSTLIGGFNTSSRTTFVQNILSQPYSLFISYLSEGVLYRTVFKSGHCKISRYNKDGALVGETNLDNKELLKNTLIHYSTRNPTLVNDKASFINLIRSVGPARPALIVDRDNEQNNYLILGSVNMKSSVYFPGGANPLGMLVGLTMSSVLNLTAPLEGTYMHGTLTILNDHNLVPISQDKLVSQRRRLDDFEVSRFEKKMDLDVSAKKYIKVNHSVFGVYFNKASKTITILNFPI